MTRLTPSQVRDIPSSLAVCDESYRKIVGAGISEIGAYASGYNGDPKKAFIGITSRVVPMTSGKGIIGGFARAVASILGHVGLESEVTESPDIRGIAEALEGGSRIVFAADDRLFMGLNLNSLRVAYNHIATGRAYSAALALRVGGISGKKVSLLGAGRVGSAAAEYLTMQGAEVFVFDLDQGKVMALKKRIPLVVECTSLSDCLERGDHVISTVPAPGLIQARHVKEGAIFSIPAMPIGLTKAALKKLGPDNLIHDDLALGVAAMAYELVI